MISIEEHRARIGDKMREALEGYCRANNLDGSATYEITAAFKPEKSIMHVDRKAFIKALVNARCAVSQEETRYYLNGILLERVGNTLNVVATNGHILVHTALDVTGHTNDVRCSVSDVTTRKLVKRHQTSVALLIRALSKLKSATVCISLAPNRCMVDGDTYDVIDGTFPDWTRVLPRPSDCGVLTVPADQLRKFNSAVKAAMTTEAKENRRRVPHPCVRIETTHAARGDVSIQLAHEIGAEKPDPFGINAVYLRDLTASATGIVRIIPNDYAGGPVRIDCGDGVTRVAMPMRI